MPTPSRLSRKEARKRPNGAIEYEPAQERRVGNPHALSTGWTVAVFHKLVRSPRLRLNDCEIWLEFAGPHVYWTRTIMTQSPQAHAFGVMTITNRPSAASSNTDAKCASRPSSSLAPVVSATSIVSESN